MHFLAAFLITGVLAAAPQSNNPKPNSKQERTASRSITGCLDQRGETYILRSETDMAMVTQLRAKGFNEDNFARYIGQKVRVHGSDAGSTFEVQKIETVAKACSS